ncbi:hypothetical protein [Streptosporangium sp. NPDC000509]|uniref:hypothetical protein n=1 Tax=Streptosporangium sp. NPDC000509 TaxID=3366186 RepID=UPI0036A01E04
MAIDGFVLDLPGTPADLEEFSKDSVGGYESAFPQARVVVIGECAAHAIVAADVSGCWDSEQILACSLSERLEEDMPLLSSAVVSRRPPNLFEDVRQVLDRRHTGAGENRHRDRKNVMAIWKENNENVK